LRDFLKVWKPRRFALCGAMLGLLVPLLVEGIFYIHPFGAGPLVFFLWPSSIQLMVLEFHPSQFEVGLIYIESIGLNILLYSAAGWLVGFLLKYSRTHPQ
jgi:hypothetical protein